MEAVGELEDLGELQYPDSRKKIRVISFSFECFYVNAKLKIKSSVAAGVSQHFRSVTSDQTESHFINLSSNLIFSDFPRTTSW